MNDFPFSEHVVVYTRDTCVFIVLRRFTKSMCLRVALARSSRRSIGSSRKRVLPALAALALHVQGSTRGTPAARILLAQQPLSFSPRKNTEERWAGQIPAPFSRIDISIAYIYEMHTSGQIPLYIPFLERLAYLSK